MGKAIGIDLGTTNTVVTYRDKKGKMKVFKENGESAIPSAVYLLSKNSCLIGEEALRRGRINSEALITNFKYDMGENRKKIYKAENGDKVSLSSTQVARMILEEVLKKVTKKIMKDFPGEDIEKAIITVPAKFNPLQKENTKKAAIGAGIQEVKLALESTAAAIAYIEENDIKSKILVYDFGGGTFDVSLIEKTGTGFKEVVTPEGDRHLGGNLITKRVADYLFDMIENELGLEIPKDRDDFDPDDYEFDYPEKIYITNYNTVYEIAEKIKKDFADIDNVEESITIIVPDENGESVENLEINMDYESFSNLIEKDIDRTIDIVDRVIQESGVDKDEITVILTGGSSLLRAVGIKLEEYFDRGIEVFRTATLISEGACILTEIIDGLEIEGNLPNDIGVKVNKALGRVEFEPLLEAGTVERDAVGEKDFSLTSDNQRNLKVQLYERDRNNYPNAIKISDEGCVEIGTLEVDLPENLKKDDTVVKLKLNILKDGTLALNISLHNRNGAKIFSEELKVKREGVLE